MGGTDRGEDHPARPGRHLPDIYADPDRSASEYQQRARENFAALRQAITSGRYRVIWYWATSRQTRGDVPLDELIKESKEHGVLWCFNGQVLNPASTDDWMHLQMHYLMDRAGSDRTSKDVLRGQKSLAAMGLPGRRVAYGYRRVHEVVAGKPRWVRDEADIAYDRNGDPVENSPGYVVAEIYDRIERGDPVARIARELEDRKVYTPQPPRVEGRSEYHWTPHAVVFIARNPVYIRKRIYQAASWRPADRHAAILEGVTGQWPELVSEEKWWAVQRILGSPDRLTFKPGKSSTLLGGAIRCGVCSDPLYLHRDAARGNVPYYVCSRRSHVAIRMDWLDAYVEDRLVSWMADPEVHAYLWGQRGEDSAVAEAAQAEVDKLETKIEQVRVQAEDPDADSVLLERRSRKLLAKLAEARKLLTPPSLSPMLADMIGPDAADRWWRLREENVAAAKQLIRAVADIRVHRGARGGDRYRPAIDPARISWAWLTGPGDRTPVHGEHVKRPNELAEDALLASPAEADRVLARQVGVTGRTVQLARRRLEAAGRIPTVRRRGRGRPVTA